MPVTAYASHCLCQSLPMPVTAYASHCLCQSLPIPVTAYASHCLRCPYINLCYTYDTSHCVFRQPTNPMFMVQAPLSVTSLQYCLSAVSVSCLHVRTHLVCMECKVRTMVFSCSSAYIRNIQTAECHCISVKYPAPGLLR
jgi:hypothetical protein